MTKNFNSHNPNQNRTSPELKHLSARHISMLEEAIEAVGEYGEVHLKVEKGRLRFIVTQTSQDALNIEAGNFEK